MRFTTSISASTGIVAALLLGACHKSKDVSMTNASIDQVAATQTKQIKPGEWEMTADISMDASGAPSALGPMPKLAPSTSRICITLEQAAKPDAVLGGPGMSQFKQNCTYDKFEIANGQITSVMHCTMPGGMALKASNSGTVSDTAMSIEGDSEVTMPGGMVTKSHTKITGKRLGECQPGDLQPGQPPQVGGQIDALPGPGNGAGAGAGAGAGSGAGASVTQ